MWLDVVFPEGIRAKIHEQCYSKHDINQDGFCCFGPGNQHILAAIVSTNFAFGKPNMIISNLTLEMGLPNELSI